MVSNMCYFHFIYGMSSFPLTNIFQDGYCTTNQMILVCQKMGSTPKLRCCCGESIVENDNQRSWISSGNAWCLIFWPHQKDMCCFCRMILIVFASECSSMQLLSAFQGCYMLLLVSKGMMGTGQVSRCVSRIVFPCAPNTSNGKAGLV